METLIEGARDECVCLSAKRGTLRQNSSNVLNGHTAWSADLAVRFETAFGLRAETLLRRQASRDLALAHRCAADLHIPAMPTSAA